MYRFSRRSRLGVFAVLAVALLMVTALVPMAADESDAANQTGTLSVQPGQTWSWTPTFKNSMTPTVTVSASDSAMPADNATFAATSGNASVTSGTVKVSIPSDYSKSQYYVKVRAQTTLPTQTIYYELTFNTSKITLAYNVSTVNAKVGTAITAMTPTVSGTTSTVSSYSISGTLPTGLSFDTSTGKITGTPTAYKAQTSYNITAKLNTTPVQTVSATVSIGAYTNITASNYTVYAITGTTEITVPGVTMPTGTTLSGMTVSVTKDGAAGSVTAGTAYNGMTVEAKTGKITGTPSVAGKYIFTEKYTATAATGGSSAQRTVTVVVEDKVALSGSNFNSFVGHEDSTTLTKTAGPSSVAWSISKITKDGTQITSGTDFTGFSVTNGVLKCGTGVSKGTYVVTVQIKTSNTTTNTSGATGASTSSNVATKAITVTVNPIITLAEKTFYMAADKVYDKLTLAANVDATFSVTDYGTLTSSNIAVSSAGVVTPGTTAPAVGDYEVTVKAVDKKNSANTVTATLNVHVAYALLFQNTPTAGQLLSS